MSISPLIGHLFLSPDKIYYQVRVNLAEIRILFLHDMGTSVEGLQPCRIFPAEGEGMHIGDIYTVYMYIESTKSWKKSEEVRM